LSEQYWGSGGRFIRYTHLKSMRNLIVAALLAAPALCGAARQVSRGGGQDADQFTPAASSGNAIEGILGDRMRVKPGRASAAG